MEISQRLKLQEGNWKRWLGDSMIRADFGKCLTLEAHSSDISFTPVPFNLLVFPSIIQTTPFLLYQEQKPLKKGSSYGMPAHVLFVGNPNDGI